MSDHSFLATTGKGIARAKQAANDAWQVDHLLADQDVRCLAANPHNLQVVYAGTQGNGLLRSVDQGQTWRPSGLEGSIVKSIAVSPHHPDLIYAGTKPAYLYRSQDGGASWQELEGFRHIPGRWWWFSPAETPNKAYVQSIAISPSDPNVILAGIEFGAVVRSQDGGMTWSGHRPGALRDCHDLKFHAIDGQRVYEAGGTGGGASCSQDGGITWRKMKQGLAKNYGVACAADPIDGETWYVSVAPGPGKAYGEGAEAYLYRSRGGETWGAVGWVTQPMPRMPIALVSIPGAPGQLYAGLTSGDVWHTADYGDTWQKLPFNLGGIHRTLIMM